MKATELMIGDWVIDTYTNKPFRIEAVKEKMGEGLEPIHLTPEILKKNGFEYYHKNFASTDYDSPFKLEMVGWPDENGNGGLWLINGLFKIRFVHELQHALRLCEIEKEIVL